MWKTTPGSELGLSCVRTRTHTVSPTNWQPASLPGLGIQLVSPPNMNSHVGARQLLLSTASVLDESLHRGSGFKHLLHEFHLQTQKMLGPALFESKMCLLLTIYSNVAGLLHV